MALKAAKQAKQEALKFPKSGRAACQRAIREKEKKWAKWIEEAEAHNDEQQVKTLGDRAYIALRRLRQTKVGREAQIELIKSLPDEHYEEQ
jgi:hypothetical protein